jgi:hypothetical protein
MVLSRFRQAIAAIRRPRKGKAGGDRPDLSRHAARIIDEMAVATFVLDRLTGRFSIARASRRSEPPRPRAARVAAE